MCPMQEASLGHFVHQSYDLNSLATSQTFFALYKINLSVDISKFGTDFGNPLFEILSHKTTLYSDL